MNPQVDHYFIDGCGRCPLGGTPQCKVHKWTQELIALRSILINCGLTEELKWGMPCYTFQKKNVVILSAFKESCTISFFKGALLSNEHQLLTAPGENSRTTRQFKFTDLNEILQNEKTIKASIFEAIEIEKAGLEIEKSSDLPPIPDEFQELLDENQLLKSAFENLTPGRQRGYLLFISQAKQSKTRLKRIEKYIPKILKGEGLNY